jgi:pSer/pThr/pTyr-binding forkhead associated (FHA) protein
MSQSQYALIVALPEGTIHHYLLSAKEITIGRGEGNAIVLDWETVSSRHCCLKRTEKGFDLIDLNSTNGTKLKGEPVSEKPVSLSHGDAMVIGTNVKARFVELEEITEQEKKTPANQGGRTQRLQVTPKLPEMPSINPVAAAVAKAGKQGGRR